MPRLPSSTDSVDSNTAPSLSSSPDPSASNSSSSHTPSSSYASATPYALAFETALPNMRLLALPRDHVVQGLSPTGLQEVYLQYEYESRGGEGARPVRRHAYQTQLDRSGRKPNEFDQRFGPLVDALTGGSPMTFEKTDSHLVSLVTKLCGALADGSDGPSGVHRVEILQQREDLASRMRTHRHAPLEQDVTATMRGLFELANRLFHDPTMWAEQPDIDVGWCLTRSDQKASPDAALTRGALNESPAAACELKRHSTAFIDVIVERGNFELTFSNGRADVRGLAIGAIQRLLQIIGEFQLMRTGIILFGHPDQMMVFELVSRTHIKYCAPVPATGRRIGSQSGDSREWHVHPFTLLLAAAFADEAPVEALLSEEHVLSLLSRDVKAPQSGVSAISPNPPTSSLPPRRSTRLPSHSQPSTMADNSTITTMPSLHVEAYKGLAGYATRVELRNASNLEFICLMPPSPAVLANPIPIDEHPSPTPSISSYGSHNSTTGSTTSQRVPSLVYDGSSDDEQRASTRFLPFTPQRDDEPMRPELPPSPSPISRKCPPPCLSDRMLVADHHPCSARDPAQGACAMPERDFQSALQTESPTAWSLTLDEMLAAGKELDTYRATLRLPDQRSCTLIAHATASLQYPDAAGFFADEADTFRRLDHLQGRQIARCYGLWRGTCTLPPLSGIPERLCVLDILLTEDLGDADLGDILYDDPRAAGRFLTAFPALMDEIWRAGAVSAIGIPDMDGISVVSNSAPPILRISSFPDMVFTGEPHFDKLAENQKGWLDVWVERASRWAPGPAG